MRHQTLLLVVIFSFGCSVAVGQGADAVDTGTVAQAAVKTGGSHVAARKTATAIDASMSVSGKQIALKLEPEPLLSYQTVIRQWSKGSAWVWGDQGRPAAMLSLVTLNGSRRRYYEFLSFSKNPLVLRESAGGAVWRPKPAWTPAVVVKTKPPSDSRRLRLVQMRNIARRFSAYQRDFFEDPQGARHDMRMLSQPIYRYKGESDESLDGGFFAFVRNGDLELLLVIDAEKGKADEPARWVYAAYPVTVHELNLLLDKTPVWHLANKSISAVQVPTEKYFLFARSATDEEVSSNAGSP